MLAPLYVVFPGEMTLLAELRDSQSGAILVRAADREKGRDFGNLQIASRVTNSAEAQRAFAMWAGLHVGRQSDPDGTSSRSSSPGI